MRLSTLAIFFTAVFFCVAFEAQGGTSREVERNNLIEREGLTYEINTEKPFTGIAVAYWPNRKKKEAHEFLNGKQHGKSTFWYENGKKSQEDEYRNGIRHGRLTMWYENGQKQAEGEYREGIQQGEATVWDEEGMKL
jgi:antitoxin component YwqK of YwqJK toxin-antitoxin module